MASVRFFLFEIASASAVLHTQPMNLQVFWFHYEISNVLGVQKFHLNEQINAQFKNLNEQISKNHSRFNCRVYFVDS